MSSTTNTRGETPPDDPPAITKAEESAIADMVAGSVNEHAIMELVVQNAMAEKEAEIVALKNELAAEKEAVLTVYRRAETSLAGITDGETYVLQQQSDLQARLVEIDEKKKAMRAAITAFNAALQNI